MGVLISNNGAITLPCALLLLGIPFIAIGQYRCNKEEIHSCYNINASASASPRTITSFANLFSFSDKPFQWNVGILCISLAILIVISESNIFQTYFKNSATAVRKDEDDIQTELMSTHYTYEEIIEQIESFTNQHIQQRLGLKKEKKTKEEEHDGEDDNKDKDKEEKKEKKEKEADFEISSKRNLKQIICCLNALAFKIDTIHKYNNKPVVMIHNNTYNNTNDDDDDDTKNKNDDLFLSSQEVSFLVLRTYPNNNEIIASSLSLLALTAKSKSVRKRYLNEKDMYDLTLPIEIMKSSLERTKKQELHQTTSKASDNHVEHEEKNTEEKQEEQEQLAAEVQRKGCIYLGALSDGDKKLASLITERGGLERILDSMNWFRYHLHVINWALWAIFNQCFDHVGNKAEFVSLDGIETICRAMKNILKEEKKGNDNDNVDNTKEETNIKSDDKDEEYLEVARHGIAILFDLLRYDASTTDNANQPSLNFMHVRRVAMNAGLHEVLTLAMTRFSMNTEVMMMGQQMLIATGYTGEIPSFDGSIICKK